MFTFVFDGGMFGGIFGIGYLLMTLFAALIFYCACVIGAWSDEQREGGDVVEESECPFVFDARKLAKEPIG